MDEATLTGTVFSLCIFSDWIASGLTSEAVYVGTVSTYSAAVALGRALCYIWHLSILIHFEKGCEYFGWFLA